MLTAQGLGGALVFVATKNVMSPGKDFAAYSAAKAAEAQLAKVLALEGAPHGIRSNIVNPDAVFQDSKLWSEEIRRERAAAQGITVDQLEDFYRKRNLLGARHPAGRRRRGGALPRLRPLRQDDGLHADGRRRREGRLPPVTAAVSAPALAPSAGRAVRAGPAPRGAGLRLGVDGRPRVLPQPDPRVAHPAGVLRADHEADQARHRRLSPGAALAGGGRQVSATLDVLSGGRLVFGVGVGGENPKEFEVCGIPAQRARRPRQRGIDAVRTLWRDTPASFHGRFTAVRGVSIDPKPVQQLAADLDRRAAPTRRWRARAVRATAGCPTSCSPSATRRASTRSARRGHAGRSLDGSRRPPGLHHGRPRLESRQARVGARALPGATRRTSSRSPASTASSARRSSAPSSSSASAPPAATTSIMNPIGDPGRARAARADRRARSCPCCAPGAPPGGRSPLGASDARKPVAGRARVTAVARWRARCSRPTWP